MDTEQTINDPFDEYEKLGDQIAKKISAQANRVAEKRQALNDATIQLDAMVARAIDMGRPRSQLGMPVRQITSALQRHRKRNSQTASKKTGNK